MQWIHNIMQPWQRTWNNDYLCSGKFGARIPVRAGDIFLFQNRPDRVWGPPSLAFNRYRGSFPKVEWWKCKVDHLPPTGTEVKNEWSYTSIPPICLQGQEREKFYIFYLWNTKLFVSKVIVEWCGVGLTPKYDYIQSVCTCKLTDILEYKNSKYPSFKIFRIDVTVSL